MTSAAPGFLTRIGLAIARPRWALALAGDREHAGRSGTDLLAMMVIVLLATQLRAFVGAVWLALDVEAKLGVQVIVRLLTRSLSVDLAFLVIGALVLWAGAGRHRNLGRAFDLLCVATLPLLIVELVAGVIVRALDLAPPPALGWGLTALSFGWGGALVALALRTARVPRPPPAVPAEVVRPARRVGLGLLALAVAGVVVHVTWLARNAEQLRPVDEGAPAPRFALSAVGPGGALGERFTLAPGKVTVVDFWATWCGPCLNAMPKLDRIARTRPDVDVVAVNLDDAAAARALFDEAGYRIVLLADDGATSERYGVSSIPHTVVIDARGVVRHVARGDAGDLADVVDAIAGEIRK